MQIPFATIERLAIYVRCLRHLKEQGIKKISSFEMAQHTRTTPEQVRKDLSYFGKFGKTGEGYDVENLLKKLEKILRTKRKWNVAIIGAGSLGTALSKYRGFKEVGYDVKAMFDIDPEKINKKINGVPVYHIEKFSEITEKEDIEIAIVAVPVEAVSDVEEVIVKSKIKGILNFVPVTLNLKTRRRIVVLDVDLTQKLYIISYLIKNKWEE
ncbi:redox-sensing transcriptional repressor Rex [Caldisericum sp.]|uniref:redox-sensing transcriptional repressor Rex n=1 Tax=Caldisericum sp. TaxID=2499687 RepID=UPI003D11BB36